MLALLIACGVPDFSIDGEVDGLGFPGGVGTAFYGGPYVVFSPQTLDCMEVAWVERNYREGEAPTELDVTLLQITFLSTDVQDGYYSVEGEAPITAKLLHAVDGALSQHRADAGQVEVDAFEWEEPTSGTLDLTFDEGSLRSDWHATWCLNLEE